MTKAGKHNIRTLAGAALAGFIILILPCRTWAQSTLSQNQDGFSGARMDGFMDSGPDKDSTVVERKVNHDYNQWTIDPISGIAAPVQPDTLHHSFHSVHLTEGMYGSYSHLGNMGSPRLSRLFFERNAVQDFIFDSPFDSWITTPTDFRFTDTKTPHLNIDYYKGGDKRTGEDHIDGYFAANFNKRVGIGFDMDYLLGRGRYDNQSTSFFDARVYAYYRGDFYNMHISANSDEMKLAENGGIQDQRYITSPESMAEGRKSYSPEDIPFRLYDNWNNITHKQLLFNQSIPVTRKIVKTRKREIAESLSGDSIRENVFPEIGDSIHSIDSIRTMDFALEHDSLYGSDSIMTGLAALDDSLAVDSIETYVETLSLGKLAHSLEIGKLGRRNISYTQPTGFYSRQFLENDSIDLFSNFYVNNTLSLSLLEGSTRWAIASLTGFISHEYKYFEMPDIDNTNGSREFVHRYTEYDVTAGARLEKAKGENLTFNALAQTSIAGYNVGDFNVDGSLTLRDSLLGKGSQLQANVSLSGLSPAFFMEKFHSTFAWWDNSFDNEFRTSVGVSGTLEKTGTCLSLNFENIGGYIYLENTGGAYVNGDNVTQPSYLIEARQADGQTRVISASLDQKFKLGPLHLDGRVTWQKTSDKRILPLPELNAFADVYLKFVYAKRLNMEIGANATYFTRYDAPGYCPAVGMYHLQSGECIQQVGGYPLLTGYVNCSLRGVRFYVLYYHANDGLMNSSDSFIVPGYPANPGMLKFGISWTFFD